MTWLVDNIYYYLGLNDNTDPGLKEVYAKNLLRKHIRNKLSQKKYDEVKNLRENISALRIQNCWLYHLKLKKRIETRRNDRLKKINYMKKL